MKKIRVIFVIGMHRSGTSLLGSAVESMGFSLGKNKCQLLSNENKKGFFENDKIIEFNDFLLNKVGGRWDSYVFDTTMLEPILDDKSIINDAINILNEEFGKKNKIVIKDPRCCLLIPFWSKVLQVWGVDESEVCYLYIYRNALEVAQSQKIRKQKNADFYSIGDNYESTIALWFTYTRVLLESLLEKNVKILNFRDIINSPEVTYEAISDFVGSVLDEHRMRIYSQCFVDKALYRSRDIEEEFSLAYPNLAKLIQELDRMTLLKNKENIGTLRNLVDGSNTVKEIRACESNIVAGLLSTMIQTKTQYKNQLNKCLEINSTNEARLIDFEKTVSDLNVELDRVNKEWNHLNDIINSSLIIKFIFALKNKIKEMKISMINKLAIFYFQIIKSLRKPYVAIRYKWPVLHENMLPLLKINRRIKNEIYSGISNFSFSTCDRYSKVSSNITYQPLVSIIVPNYNHADYLTERLESIFNQTYKNYEVILLDDCSKDNSQKILATYQKKYSDKTFYFPNDKNSGGVFNQWQKGIELAKGELIWIAESDDYCSENFLSDLVKEFKDESVRLAFSNTKFVKNNEIIWTLSDYLSEFEKFDFSTSFVKPAFYLMNNGFGVKNFIPNVSSALFRKAGLEKIINDSTWKNMRVCGDWVFYSNLAVGGCIAYVASATNFYRQHESNTSVSSHKMRKFYEEHHTVAAYNIRNYRLSSSIVNQQLKSLNEHRIASGAPFSLDELEILYKPDQLKAYINDEKNRRINILLVGYAFVSGGGETFPIQLANIFKEKGHAVTYLDCCEAESNPGIRDMLRKDIPVINEFFKLNQIVKDFGIDIIHSHHAWVDVNIMEILNHDLDVKHIVSMHGMYEMMDVDRQREILTQLHEKCSHLVYTADKNLEPLKSLGLGDSKKLSKVDNALEVYEFKPISRQELGISKQAKVFCLVSRAIKDKGWQEAIDAIQYAIERSQKDIQLILIGDGPEYNRLLEEGVPEFVHLLGFKSNIREYFAMSDFALLPSKFKGESYPLVVIDAIHAGVPVIATDIGEIRNMLTSIEGVNGELLPLDDWTIDTQALGDLIVLAQDKAYEYYEPALLAAKDKFSPERLYQNYLSIYRKEK